MTVVRTTGVSVEDYYQAPPGMAPLVGFYLLGPGKARTRAPGLERCAHSQDVSADSGPIHAERGLAQVTAQGGQHVVARRPPGLLVCWPCLHAAESV